MKPCDFYFSDSSQSLSDLTFEPSILLHDEKKKELDVNRHFTKNDFVFQAEKDLSLGAFYKKEGDYILIASAFGAYKMELPGDKKAELYDFEEGVKLSFKSHSTVGEVAYWSAKVRSCWADEMGEKSSDLWMRATKKHEGWIPPYRVYQFRTRRGRVEYCTILMPSKAKKIERTSVGVLITTEDHQFIIEDPLASKIILEGHIQWGYPQANGVFKLEDPLV